MKQILLTGGAGYIGSHTALVLIENGYVPIVIDNYSNSYDYSLQSVEKLTNTSITRYNGDMADVFLLRKIFSIHEISGVIHFGAYKSVEESVNKPLKYYDNNVGGLLTVLKLMEEFGVRPFVFSSSCTVYGDSYSSSISETSPLSFSSPYGHSKLLGENIVLLLSASKTITSSILRYFNPAGAHHSGMLGELPLGKPRNIFPALCDVYKGKQEFITVYGNDYNTRDGTPIRDYVHIMDLADAHVTALKFIIRGKDSNILNIGSGKGSTVLEVIKTFSNVVNKKIKINFADRRPGDVPIAQANICKAKDLLGWEPRYNLDQICKSAANWAINNDKL